MIYITGDTHADIARFSEAATPGESKWTAADTLIICGDFGFIWYNEDDGDAYAADQAALDELAKKPYTILFIDGNHENFDRLYQYPLEPGFGGTVRRIRDNLFHLQRGQVYTIGGKSFFTFGGAYSVDKYARVEGVSWWHQEQPTRAEMMRGDEALNCADRQVDYIITHTAPQTIIRMMGYGPEPHDRELTFYFDQIWRTTNFRKWFFGHMHDDRIKPVAGRAYPMFYRVAAIEE